MNKSFFLAGLFLLPGLASIGAAPLTESTFTEIIRDAKVVAAADKSVVPARTNMVFQAPDRVRTGAASRVEMTAPDKTITRIGANTIFTFEAGGRSIQLEKGSILFHAPAGVGGGTIQYHGTSAAVLGTTMICAVLPDGSFKILDLEGLVKVTLKNGISIVLKAGQLIIVPPDGNELHDPEFFNLGKVISRLVLVVGFSQPLSSLPLILATIQQQQHDFADGTVEYVVDFNQAVFGLEIVYRDMNPGLPYPPETPDHTMFPVTPVHP
ncbi:MAG TPA: FecR domain-containing protein [Verrucomicrobiae bacterium]